MRQTRLETLLETITDIGSGLLITIFLVQPLVCYIFHIQTTLSQNTAIAIIFTIASIIRKYTIRRVFETRGWQRITRMRKK